VGINNLTRELVLARERGGAPRYTILWGEYGGECLPGGAGSRPRPWVWRLRAHAKEGPRFLCVQILLASFSFTWSKVSTRKRLLQPSNMHVCMCALLSFHRYQFSEPVLVLAYCSPRLCQFVALLLWPVQSMRSWSFSKTRFVRTSNLIRTQTVSQRILPPVRQSLKIIRACLVFVRLNNLDVLRIWKLKASKS
jgi:hypothetical protein